MADPNAKLKKINALAAKEHLSYGQFVSKYGEGDIRKMLKESKKRGKK